jgi:hypothetical protein
MSAPRIEAAARRQCGGNCVTAYSNGAYHFTGRKGVRVWPSVVSPPLPRVFVEFFSVQCVAVRALAGPTCEQGNITGDILLNRNAALM